MYSSRINKMGTSKMLLEPVWACHNPGKLRSAGHGPIDLKLNFIATHPQGTVASEPQSLHVPLMSILCTESWARNTPLLVSRADFRNISLSDSSDIFRNPRSARAALGPCKLVFLVMQFAIVHYVVCTSFSLIYTQDYYRRTLMDLILGANIRSENSIG